MSTYLTALVLFVTCACGFARGAVYYVSPQGDDAAPGTRERPWRTLQKAAETLGPGDTARILEAVYRERVRVLSSGRQGRPIVFENEPGHAPTVDAGGVERARGVFEIQGQAHVRVSGLKLIGGGQRGRSGFLLRRAHHVTIQGCHTLRTGSSGVKLIECRDVVVDGNEIERACLSGAEECITVKMDSDCVRVSNNHIHDCRKEGIDVKEGARNVRVSGNHIHHVERQGLYTDAWDRETFNVEFSGNVIHDCGFGIAACSETGGLLHDVRICNNVVYNCAGPGLVLADWGRGENHPVRSVAFINNTVHRCGSRWGGGMHFYTTEAENVLVRNNIFSLCGPPPVDMRKEPVSRRIDHNLFHGPDRAFGLAAVRGDPLFVDADGGDFRLRPGSPAIDAGSPEEAPGRDIGGRERPWGDGMDIGAWEYTGGTQAGKKQGERQ